uniref:Uncharacterized protein n=1 Tax=Peronospora matthiolae TaxID=2874970 RepID=A0AAV1U719_9STRA
MRLCDFGSAEIWLRMRSSNSMNFSLGDACTKLLGDVLAPGRLEAADALDLGFNRITNTGATQLAEALKTSTSLRTLCTSQEMILDRQVSRSCAALALRFAPRSLHLGLATIIWRRRIACFLMNGITGFDHHAEALYLVYEWVSAAGMQKSSWR